MVCFVCEAEVCTFDSTWRVRESFSPPFPEQSCQTHSTFARIMAVSALGRHGPHPNGRIGRWHVCFPSLSPWYIPSRHAPDIGHEGMGY